MPLEELRTALHDAVEAGEPPVGSGPAAVFARADRVRARRRLTVVAGGITVLGLVAGAAALAANQPAAPSTPAVAKPSPAPASLSPSPSPSPTRRLAEPPADVMIKTLQDLLPAGATVAHPFSQQGYAEVILIDQAGSGKVEVNVQPRFTEEVPGHTGGDPLTNLFSCATRPADPRTHCTDVTRPDGTRGVLTEGPSEDAGHDRIKRRLVDVIRPDGVRIAVATWNAEREKTNTATRADPPLTLPQLLAIATDPAWAA